MSMSERVKKLRRQSLEAVETLSPERAELMTEFSSTGYWIGVNPGATEHWHSST